MRTPTAEIGRGPCGSRKAVGGGAAAIAGNDRAWAAVQGWTGAAVAVIDWAGAAVAVIDWAGAAEVICCGHVAGMRPWPSRAESAGVKGRRRCERPVGPRRGRRDGSLARGARLQRRANGDAGSNGRRTSRRHSPTRRRTDTSRVRASPGRTSIDRCRRRNSTAPSSRASRVSTGRPRRPCSRRLRRSPCSRSAMTTTPAALLRAKIRETSIELLRETPRSAARARTRPKPSRRASLSAIRGRCRGERRQAHFEFENHLALTRSNSRYRSSEGRGEREGSPVGKPRRHPRFTRRLQRSERLAFGRRCCVRTGWRRVRPAHERFCRARPEWGSTRPDRASRRVPNRTAFP